MNSVRKVDGTADTVLILSPPSHVKSEFIRPSFWKRFRAHKVAVVSTFVLIVFSLGALFAPSIAPYPPQKIHPTAFTQPPSSTHLLGTDTSGRDVLSRLIYGARVSLAVGLIAASIASIVGMLIGLVSGYFGGRIDFWLMRFTDMVMTLPTLIIIIAVVAALGPGMGKIMVVIGLFGWPSTARLVRAECLSLRERDFVVAVRALGASNAHIITYHILPNTIAPVIVAGTLTVAGAILTEASLSFLGIGVQIPTPTWGNMLSDAQSLTVLESMTWLWLPSGFLITITVVSINFIGDALRDTLDPRL